MLAGLLLAAARAVVVLPVPSCDAAQRPTGRSPGAASKERRGGVTAAGNIRCLGNPRRGPLYARGPVRQRKNSSVPPPGTSPADCEPTARCIAVPSSPISSRKAFPIANTAVFRSPSPPSTPLRAESPLAGSRTLRVSVGAPQAGALVRGGQDKSGAQ